MRKGQISPRFIGVSAALYFGSAALTVDWCESMSTIDSAPMCSIRGTTNALYGAAVFPAMWVVMMTAMMLPSLFPMLLRYRHAVAVTAPRLDALTALVGAGYFFVWMLFGVLAFAASLGLSLMETRWHATQMITGFAMLLAGALQFSAWKARHLVCCRGEPCCLLPDYAGAAWRHGVRLGMHCVHCCFGFTVVLLVIGTMDVRAMTLVTIAISIERFAPGGLRAARWVGIVLVSAGAFLITHAATESFL